MPISAREQELPIYEYECQKCHHRFEKIQQYSDPPEKKCPKCGGKLEKVITAAAVQFKGSGWYVTDYARKGSSGGSKHESSESKVESSAEKTDSKSKTESKSESKPESKSPKKK
jgi:putative FmdB family regulatory protein